MAKRRRRRRFKVGLACASKATRRRVAIKGGKARWRKAYRDYYRRRRRRRKKHKWF